MPRQATQIKYTSWSFQYPQIHTLHAQHSSQSSPLYPIHGWLHSPHLSCSSPSTLFLKTSWGCEEVSCTSASDEGRALKIRQKKGQLQEEPSDDDSIFLLPEWARCSFSHSNWVSSNFCERHQRRHLLASSFGSSTFRNIGQSHGIQISNLSQNSFWSATRVEIALLGMSLEMLPITRVSFLYVSRIFFHSILAGLKKATSKDCRQDK